MPSTFYLQAGETRGSGRLDHSPERGMDAGRCPHTALRAGGLPERPIPPAEHSLRGATVPSAGHAVLPSASPGPPGGPNAHGGGPAKPRSGEAWEKAW